MYTNLSNGEDMVKTQLSNAIACTAEMCIFASMLNFQNKAILMTGGQEGLGVCHCRKFDLATNQWQSLPLLN